MARITRTSREEMETLVVLDPVGQRAGSTASPAMARRWKRLGYPVDVLGRYRDGEPRTWETTVPAKAVRWKALALVLHPTRRPRQGENPRYSPKETAVPPVPGDPAGGTEA